MKKIILIACLFFLNYSFCQLSDTINKSDVKIETNGNLSYALVNANGELITPYLFASLKKVNNNSYLFDAHPKFKGHLQLFLDSLISLESATKITEGNSTEYDVFQGFIDSTGRIIGGKDFRMIEEVQGAAKSPFFLAQSYIEINDNDNWLNAIVSEDGVVMSPFIYEMIWSKDDNLFGTQYINGSFITVKLDTFGQVIQTLKSK